MSNPLPRDVYVDPLMTNFSVSYQLNSGLFEARTVFPTVSVDEQSGIYAVYPRGHFMRNEMRVRPLGGTPEYIDHNVEYQNYRAEEFATGKKIDDRVRANSKRDPLAPDRNATALLSNNAIINWEESWAKNFFKPGVWTNEYRGVTSNPGDGEFLRFNQAGAQIVAFIQQLGDDMEEATGYRPNRLTLGAKVYRTIVQDPEIIDRIKYSQQGIVTAGLLSTLFEVNSVNVARASSNKAKEGQADNIKRIADPRSFLLSYADTSGSVTTDTVTAGASFAWTGLIPGQTNALGGVITRGRLPEAYSDWLHIRQAFDQKVVAPDLAVFAYDVVD